MFKALVLTSLTLLFLSIFLVLNHPFSLALLVALLRLFSSLLIFSFSLRAWFPFILRIVYLRGIIIIFLYAASLTPNIRPQLLLNPRALLALIPLFLALLNFKPSLNNIVLLPKLSSISHLFQAHSALFTSFVITYLLIALLVVVKIMNFKPLPLRSNIYDKPSS